MNDLPRRIAIIGPTGSGKSTLARRIGRRLGCEHVELDALFHEPGWTPAETEAFRARAASRLSGPAWIVDGNYAVVRDLTWGRADLIIWLDFPLPLVLWRLFWRVMRRGLRHEMLWNGNSDSLRTHFLTRESLFLWAVQSHRRRRRTYPAQLAAQAAAVARVRSPRELERWLRERGL